MRARLEVCLAAFCVACGTEHSETEPPPPVDPRGCTYGELTLPDGSCRPAGVPPEWCEAGFEPDGRGGCNAILPAEPCPHGTMAIVGETSCREVAPCGDGDWGAIPIASDTVYVDGAYTGSVSDGSASQPFTTIQSAVAAAPVGAIVAIAEGRYVADVLLQKDVHLWGRCPALVEIAGTGAQLATVGVTATGAEIHDLAVTGVQFGVGIVGALDVVLDRVWVHDLGWRGLGVEDELGPARATLRRSLVEAANEVGVSVHENELVMEESVVRDTAPTATCCGHGVSVSGDNAVFTGRALLIERNHAVGILGFGSSVVVERSVVRDTWLHAAEGGGVGIAMQPHDETQTRGNLKVNRSVVERSAGVGVLVNGSDATLEGITVRETIAADGDPIRGRGINVQLHPDAGGALVTVLASLVDRSHGTGLFVAGSDVTAESLFVRDTQPHPGEIGAGRAVGGQGDALPGRVVLKACRTDGSYELGVVMIDGEMHIQDSLIANAHARPDGTAGDGAVVVSDTVASTMTIERSRIAASERVGAMTFGGVLSLAGSSLECNTIDMSRQVLTEFEGDLQDLGGNRCGCAAEGRTCAAIVSDLQPPSAQ